MGGEQERAELAAFEADNAWRRAVRAAGVARVPLDFRRTVRNLGRDGVPPSVANPTAMVGQTTEEVYRRYAIVDQAMIREAAIKMNRGAKVR
jgi:hypothetical protein